ncbi:MAG: response regulator [Omnitrophica WOR_2 bacterium]
MHGRNILIVEDETDLCMVLTTIFQRAGYATSYAPTAREAITVLLDHPIHLVLLDLNLPDRDGMSLLAEIRLLDPYLPVVILTADPSMDKVTEALYKGVSDYVLKPFSPDYILNRVSELFA